MKTNVYCNRCNLGKWVCINKLLLGLALGALVFAIGCKQSNGGGNNTSSEYKITIKGDERVKVADPGYIEVPAAKSKTFGAVKTEIMAKVSLNDGWSSDDYEFYDWRKDGEEGEELTDSSSITGDIVVYARTNYKRFKVEGTILEGYEGGIPRGRIFLPKEITETKDGANHDHGAFIACEDLTAVDLTPCIHLTRIGNCTFRKCKKIASVKLNACTELVSIGDYAFDVCESLESVDLSSCTKLEQIGKYSLCHCDKLKNLNLTGLTKLTSIGEGAFDENGELESIDLSSCTKLTNIPKYMFYCDEKLKTVNLSGLGSDITSIGESAFSECKSLESIDLSSFTELEKLNHYAFFACQTLKSIDLSKCTKLTTIQESVFSGATSAKVKLPASITEIESGTFGSYDDVYCEKVLVPNDEIKTKVKEAGYPEERIEVYN